MIDFERGDGDGLTTHPIERAYGCRLRERPEVGLYFSRRGSPHWARELDDFIAALDAPG